MQRQYRLPVNALLQTLRDQNGITTLSAALPFVPEYQWEAGEVVLILGRGRIHTCTIRTANGLPLFQGGEALKALERLGSLGWYVQEFFSGNNVWSANGKAGQGAQQPQRSATEHIIPRRLVARLSPVQQQELSRRHRQVFNLIDGARSIASMATLLHLSTDEVTRLLQELRQGQFID